MNNTTNNNIGSVSQSQIAPNITNSLIINECDDGDMIIAADLNNEISISDTVRNHMDKKYQMLNLKHFLKKSNSSMDVNEDENGENFKIDSCRLILDENDKKNQIMNLNLNQVNEINKETSNNKSLKSPRSIT